MIFVLPFINGLHRADEFLEGGDALGEEVLHHGDGGGVGYFFVAGQGIAV